MTGLGQSFIGLLLAAMANGAEEHRQWQERFEFGRGSRPLIEVDNVWGSVTIRTHDSPDVLVSAEETRSARDADILERSKQLIYLVVDHRADGLTLAVDGIVRESHRHNPCPGCRLHLELELLVPADAGVDARTVMGGSVSVEGVANVIGAGNVNGDVLVHGLRSCHEIKSVNGRVSAHFVVRPEHESCRIKTVNGDMTLALPQRADATLEFDLFNGSVDSQLPVAAVPVASRVERTTHGGVTQYRITSPMTVRLGDGGPLFSFESINGDVHIEKH